MSIKRTIITTIAVLALVAVVAPGVAQGVTIDELLAQIAQLQSQLVSLQGGSSAGTGACAGVTFSRNLTVGSTGSDVKCLQVLLNNNGFKVATTGAGSPGAETTYFGSKTLVAVKAFQVSKGYTPANQVGPLTRGALNALIGAGGGNNGGQTPVPTGAGLTVLLASDTPASGTLVSGATSLANAQGGADLGHFTFVNGDNVSVKVTTLALTRIGISQDTLLNNVYLYQGANRLTDAASVASGIVNFNSSSGLFTVPAGGSVTIRVLADLYYGMSGQTVGVSLASASAVSTNASSVKGTFPVQTKLQTTAAATLATVSFQAGTSTTPTGGTVDPQNDYTVWQNVVTVSTRSVKLNRFALYQTGSALATDIQNYRLYVDGVQVGTAVASPDSNGYITFDLTSNPVTLQTGSRTIKVLADIIAGSSKTFAYSLRTSTDANFTDTQVGVGIQPQVASSTFAQVKSCYNSSDATYSCTINSGSVTFTKTADSPSGNITLGSANAVIGRFKLTAAGEPVKITDLYVYITDTTLSAAADYVRNGALYANGVQIGSTTDITAVAGAGTHFSLGSSLIVTPGTPTTLEVRGDIKESSTSTNDVTSGDSMRAVIVKTSSNAEGTVSKSTITTPAATTYGNTLTVKTGSLSLSKYLAYTNQVTVAPVTQYKLAHYTLTNDTVEPINLSAIEADLNPVSSYTTNMYVTYGTNTTTAKPTVAATNSWSINYQIPASTTIDVAVYGDVSSSMTSGSGQVSVEFCGTTANSATAVYTNSGTTCSDQVLAGQTITFSSGSFTEAFGGAPVKQAVAGNQTVEVGRFKLTAAYESRTVTEMEFTASNTAAVVSASLKDGSTVLATVPYNNALGYFNFTGLNVVVPANSYKTVTLAYNLSPGLSSSVSTTAVDVKPTLSFVKTVDPNGTVDNDSGLTYAANSTYVYKSLPTLTQVKLDNSSYINNGGEQDVYKFTVAAPTAGDVSVKQFALNVDFTDGGTAEDAPGLRLNNWKLLKDGVDITTSVRLQNASGYDITGANGNVSLGADDNAYIYVTWLTDTEDNVPAGTSTSYTLRATPNSFRLKGTGNEAGTDSVAISFTNDTATSPYCLNTGGAITNTILKLLAASSHVCQATASATTAYFIWSDESAISHAAGRDASSTDDWYTGYLLNSMSTQSWLR